jgi:hypothetical protein
MIFLNYLRSRSLFQNRWSSWSNLRSFFWWWSWADLRSLLKWSFQGLQCAVRGRGLGGFIGTFLICSPRKDWKDSRSCLPRKWHWKWPQNHWNIEKCRKMSRNVEKVQKCRKSLEMSKKSRNVEKCPEMSKNVEKPKNIKQYPERSEKKIQKCLNTAPETVSSTHF